MTSLETNAVPIPVLVIHLTTATQRRQHIEKEFAHSKLPLHWITRGDIFDITPEIEAAHFRGDLLGDHRAAIISCAYKHFLAYQAILEKGWPQALVVEDDIVLYRRFRGRLHQIQTEISQRKIANYIISIEDSALQYIPRSKRLPRRLLYKALKGRMAGSYLTDATACKNMISYIRQNKMHLPIDWMHNVMAEQHHIDIYWSQPALCVQGSISGKTSSLIDNKTSGIGRSVTFTLTRWYRQFLCFLR